VALELKKFYKGTVEFSSTTSTVKLIGKLEFVSVSYLNVLLNEFCIKFFK
jgi:hypothetical protein